MESEGAYVAAPLPRPMAVEIPEAAELDVLAFGILAAGLLLLAILRFARGQGELAASYRAFLWLLVLQAGALTLRITGYV
jgi:hypothetical protein